MVLTDVSSWQLSAEHIFGPLPEKAPTIPLGATEMQGVQYSMQALEQAQQSWGAAPWDQPYTLAVSVPGTLAPDPYRAATDYILDPYRQGAEQITTTTESIIPQVNIDTQPLMWGMLGLAAVMMLKKK